MKRKSRKTPACPAPWLHTIEPDAVMLALAATRYFIGRSSIQAHCFARQLATAWPDLPQHLRDAIQRDLTREFARDDHAKAPPDPKDRKVYHTWRVFHTDYDRQAWEQIRIAWQNLEANPNPKPNL